FVTLDVGPEKLGEAYYRLGDIYLQGQDNKSAEAKFRKCIEQGEMHFVYLARYQLAMMALKEGRTDEGEAALILNIKELRYGNDPEALAQSLFALGDLLYQRHDYRRVHLYLEDALGRFRENTQFKDNPEVTRARFQLADSYFQIAAHDNQAFLMSENISA